MAVIANGAFQVLAAGSQFPVPTLDANNNKDYNKLTIYLQNLGPNVIYAGFTQANCAAAKGVQIAATTGALAIEMRTDQTLWLLAASADQTTPNDTRYMVVAQ